LVAGYADHLWDLSDALAPYVDDIAQQKLDVNSHDGGIYGVPFDLDRSEEHTSELQSRENLVCRLLLERKNFDHGQYAVGLPVRQAAFEPWPSFCLLPRAHTRRPPSSTLFPYTTLFRSLVAGYADHLWDLSDALAPYVDDIAQQKLDVNSHDGGIYGVPFDLD